MFGQRVPHRCSVVVVVGGGGGGAWSTALSCAIRYSCRHPCACRCSVAMCCGNAVPDLARCAAMAMCWCYCQGGQLYLLARPLVRPPRSVPQLN